jgi:hypothetical protein
MSRRKMLQVSPYASLLGVFIAGNARASGRQPERGPARVLRRRSWLVSLIVCVLSLGGALLYRRGGAS